MTWYIAQIEELQSYLKWSFITKHQIYILITDCKHVYIEYKKLNSKYRNSFFLHRLGQILINLATASGILVAYMHIYIYIYTHVIDML